MKTALLLSQPPPPCEVHNCEHFTECKEMLLACRAFEYYVVNGTSPKVKIPSRFSPTKSYYDKIYKKKEKKGTI